MDTAQTTPGIVRRAPLPGAPTSNPGVLESAQALWSDMRELAHAHLQLAALETQRAGRSLVNMVVCAVAAAMLLVGAWLGLMATGAAPAAGSRTRGCGRGVIDSDGFLAN